MASQKMDKRKKKKPSRTLPSTPNPLMSSLERKNNKEEEKPSLLLSLPEDLLLTCIARVSRLYYSTLSRVSKRFRSLLSSPELYKIRSRLGKTENCLYVCLNTYQNHDNWFTLSREPDRNLTNNNTGYVLCKAPDPSCTRGDFSNFVAVGPNIYKIGGGWYSACPSSAVSILDCRSHTWRNGPSMRVKLRVVTTCALDKNIYVTGYESSGNKTIEVLDTTTQMWDPEPIPSLTEADSTCGVKFAYYPKERKWDFAGPWGRPDSDSGFRYSYCQIGNVFYCVSDGTIKWYDNEERDWRILKGLVSNNFSQDACVRLADCGGKMAFFWKERYAQTGFMSEIWCAVIALERKESCGMVGKVEWCDRVLKDVPSNMVKVLAVTV